MSNQHKKPILAFIVLAVIAAALVGSQVHARADGSRFVAAGPIAAHTQVQGGVHLLPNAHDRDNPADRSEDRAAAPDAASDSSDDAADGPGPAADSRPAQARPKPFAVLLTEPLDVPVERPVRRKDTRGNSPRPDRAETHKTRPGYAGHPGVGAAGKSRPDRHPGKHLGPGDALGHSLEHSPGQARGHDHSHTNRGPAGRPFR